MSNYEARFSELASEARRVFLNNGTAIREQIPRLFSTDFERLLKSISDLLGKVDKGNVDHPEYLAHSNGHLGDYTITLLDNFETSFANGPSHFLQTTLPSLLLAEERLVKAVGNYYYKVKGVKDRYVKELQKLAEESLEYYSQSNSAKEKIESITKEYSEASSEIKSSLENARQYVAEIVSIRERATKLASGDGRGRSLEALKRRAENKLETIEDVLAKGATANAKVDNALIALEDSEVTIKGAIGRLSQIEAKANEILALSNQAGLASSYLTESRKLATKSFAYTIILYAASLATLFAAAFYVIPSLEQSVSSSGEILNQGALLATLIRATILAPLVYVIYFTTKQISSLETLRMDYAEKAAASLAYSGYKDEMSVDDDLLDRLRGSLLLRFAEHPERLLRKNPSREAISITFPGFRASSRSDDRDTPKIDHREVGEADA